MSMSTVITNVKHARLDTGIIIGDAEVLSTSVMSMSTSSTIAKNAKVDIGTIIGVADLLLITVTSTTKQTTTNARFVGRSTGITIGDVISRLRTVKSIVTQLTNATSAIASSGITTGDAD